LYNCEIKLTAAGADTAEWTKTYTDSTLALCAMTDSQ